jgi:hypothetical protein
MLLLSRTVDSRSDQMRKNMKCLASWFGVLGYRTQAEILPCGCWRDLIGCPGIAHRWDTMTWVSILESTCMLVKRKEDVHIMASVGLQSYGVRDTMYAQMKP